MSEGGGGQTVADRGGEWTREGSRSLPPPLSSRAHRLWLRSLSPTFKHGETLCHYTTTITLTFLQSIAVITTNAITIFATIITVISGSVMTREDGEVVGEPVGDHLEPVGAAAGRGGQQVPSAHSGPPGPR